EHLAPRLLRKVERWTMTLPLLSVHLVVDLDLRERMANSTQWIRPDTDAEPFYAATQSGRIAEGGPVLMTSATVKVPDRTDAAPAGHSLLTLVSVAPAEKSAWALRSGGPSAGERYSQHPDYLEAKARLTESVID